MAEATTTTTEEQVKPDNVDPNFEFIDGDESILGEAETKEAGEEAEASAEVEAEGESEVESEEAEQPAETPKDNPKFNKALQKLQQDLSALMRKNEELERRLASDTQSKVEKPERVEPEPDPIAEVQSEIEALEKMDADDLVTGKQVAGTFKKLVAGLGKALAAKDAKIAALEGRTAADTGELRWERNWKSQNPEIADQYETLIAQTHKYVQEKYPNFKPGSEGYAGAWHAAHDARVEAAKAAKAAAKVAPKPAQTKPSQTPRKPVPPGLKPGKSGPMSSAQPDKFNPDSDNPLDWMVPGVVGL